MTCDSGSTRLSLVYILSSLRPRNIPELSCDLPVQLHNALLMSMIVVSRLDPSQDANGASSSTHPSRKRRRMLPHQDPPPKLRKWVVGLRKAERDRVRGITSAAPPLMGDEARLEKPITLRSEGKSKSNYILVPSQN